MAPRSGWFWEGNGGGRFNLTVVSPAAVKGQRAALQHSFCSKVLLFYSRPGLVTRCAWESFQQVVSIPALGSFRGVYLSDTEVAIPTKEQVKFHQQNFFAARAVRAASEGTLSQRAVQAAVSSSSNFNFMF